MTAMYAKKYDANYWAAESQTVAPSVSYGVNPYRVAWKWLKILGVATFIAVYYVMLQVKIEAHFARAEELKRANQSLVKEIDLLENKVSALKSFANIESALSEYNIQLGDPKEVFYLNLRTAAQGQRLTSGRQY
jgi:hypothetical protein